MQVLIIAPTKREFDETIAAESDYNRRHNEYKHVTAKDQMYGYRPPVAIRFIGNWWELDDAPTLEFYAQHIIGMPAA